MSAKSMSFEETAREILKQAGAGKSNMGSNTEDGGCHGMTKDMQKIKEHAHA